MLLLGGFIKLCSFRLAFLQIHGPFVGRWKRALITLKVWVFCKDFYFCFYFLLTGLKWVSCHFMLIFQCAINSISNVFWWEWHTVVDELVTACVCWVKTRENKNENVSSIFFKWSKTSVKHQQCQQNAFNSSRCDLFVQFGSPRFEKFQLI